MDIASKQDGSLLSFYATDDRLHTITYVIPLMKTHETIQVINEP